MGVGRCDGRQFTTLARAIQGAVPRRAAAATVPVAAGKRAGCRHAQQKGPPLTRGAAALGGSQWSRSLAAQWPSFFSAMRSMAL